MADSRTDIENKIGLSEYFSREKSLEHILEFGRIDNNDIIIDRFIEIIPYASKRRYGRLHHLSSRVAETVCYNILIEKGLDEKYARKCAYKLSNVARDAFRGGNHTFSVLNPNFSDLVNGIAELMLFMQAKTELSVVEKSDDREVSSEMQNNQNSISSEFENAARHQFLDRDKSVFPTAEAFLRHFYAERIGIDGDLTPATLGKLDAPLLTALNADFRHRLADLHEMLPTLKQRNDQKLKRQYGYVPEGKDRKHKLTHLARLGK